MSEMDTFIPVSLDSCTVQKQTMERYQIVLFIFKVFTCVCSVLDVILKIIIYRNITQWKVGTFNLNIYTGSSLQPVKKMQKKTACYKWVLVVKELFNIAVN